MIMDILKVVGLVIALCTLCPLCFLCDPYMGEVILWSPVYFYHGPSSHCNECYSNKNIGIVLLVKFAVCSVVVLMPSWCTTLVRGQRKHCQLSFRNDSSEGTQQHSYFMINKDPAALISPCSPHCRQHFACSS